MGNKGPDISRKKETKWKNIRDFVPNHVQSIGDPPPKSSKNKCAHNDKDILVYQMLKNAALGASKGQSSNDKG